MWRWQPNLRCNIIDEGAFGADAVLAWFTCHPGFQAARAVLVELLGARMAPLGPGMRVPEELS